MSTESKLPKSTREKMLDVAEDLITRRGPDGFKLQEVTEALGVTPPAFYAHFNDRDDLVATVARRGADEMFAYLSRPRDDGEDLTLLESNACRYIEYLYDHPAMARLILWDVSHIGVEGWTDFIATGPDVRSQIRDEFRAMRDAGSIRALRPRGFNPYFTAGAAAAVLWNEIGSQNQTEEGGSDQRVQPDVLRAEVLDLIRRLLAT